MKISFSRNHDGAPLVLVDGEVVAIAKDCEGYSQLKLSFLTFDGNELFHLGGKLAEAEVAIEEVYKKLNAATMCHPNAVEFLVEEALDSILQWKEKQK